MGAAASIKLLYASSIAGLRQYFEDGSYISDFQIIDKDSSGGISLNAFKTWLNNKAKQQVDDASYWKLFSSSTLAFTLAYEHSCSISGGVRVKDKNADNWRQGDDVGNNKLNFEEFRLASKTFTAAQAHENQTEQQMIDDFRLLDVDDDGYVDFFELSNYCVQFIDPDFGVNGSDTRGKLSSCDSYRFEVMTKTRSEPLKIIVKEMELHQMIAQKGALKLSTEMELGLLDL